MLGSEISSLRLSRLHVTLGVVMDNCFFMKQHVKKICNEANYYVRNISKIRKYLTQGSAEILIHR